MKPLQILRGFLIISLFASATIPLIIILAGAATAPTNDKTYTIKIDRPGVKGDLSEIHASLERTETTTYSTPGGPPKVDAQTLKASAEFIAEIIQVDDQGHASEFKLTVKSFTTGEGKVELESGKVFNVHRNYKETTADVEGGEPLSKEALEFIRVLFSINSKSNITADKLLDTKLPRKPGESWDVDAEVVSKDCADRQRAVVDPKDVTGTATLKNVNKWNGGDALLIATSIRIDKETGGLAAPDGYIERSRQTERHVDCTVPVDLTKRGFVSSATVDSIIVYAAANGSATTFEMKYHGTAKVAMMPIPKK